MAATITRGSIVLHPTAVLGWPLTRASRTVVHPILNTALVELTVRQPAPRAGTLDTLWATEATARAAFDAFAVAGAAWVWAVPGIGASLTAAVLDVSMDPAEETGGVWTVHTVVQELT